MYNIGATGAEGGESTLVVRPTQAKERSIDEVGRDAHNAQILQDKGKEVAEIDGHEERASREYQRYLSGPCGSKGGWEVGQEDGEIEHHTIHRVRQRQEAPRTIRLYQP